MLHQLFILIILYILITQVILYYKNTLTPIQGVPVKIDNKTDIINNTAINSSNISETIPTDLFGKPYHVEPNKYIVWTFVKPVPWTQIIYTYNHELPFKFYFKVQIPTLNDYEAWKNIIPTLDFNSKTGELIIYSKDEASALAIANLIVSHFQGHISFDTIVEKNLLQISISKAQQYEMVKNKLREQLIDALNAKFKSIQNKDTDYEEDLAVSKNNKSSKSLESFGDMGPIAYDGDEFTYL
jgi:hypothetical protein